MTAVFQRWTRTGALGASAFIAFVLVTSCTLAFPVHEGKSVEAPESGSADSGSGESGSAESGTASYRAAIIADAPSVYLRLGEANGPVAHDEIRTFDGTYPAGGVSYGVPGAIAGDTDAAISFDGTAGIQMPVGLEFSGTAAFTVEVWVKQTAYQEHGLTIDHALYASGNRDGWSLRFGTDAFGIERWRDVATSGSDSLSGFPLPLDSYHHIVATFDGSALRLYLDGKLQGDVTASSLVLKSVSSTWMIGAQNCACHGQAFIGSLDELAVYPRVLSEVQIGNHYQLGSGT